MARTHDGTTEVTTEPSDLFNSTEDGGPCTTYEVANTGSETCLVQVTGLHNQQDDSWFPIPSDERRLFRCSTNGISRIQAKTSSSTTTVGGGVVAML